MNGLKDWIYSVCIAVISVTALSMLTPNGKMEKIIKFAISMFFVSLIVFPISNFIGNANYMDYNNTHFNESKAEYGDSIIKQTELYKRKLERALTAKLNKIEIKINNLSTDINIDEENCIIINEIKIYLDNSYKSRGGEIIKLIKKEVNFTPEIKYN